MRGCQARGSVYVVGGAAIAVTVRDQRRTVDIDAVVSDQVVLEEARLLAPRRRSGSLSIGHHQSICQR